MITSIQSIKEAQRGDVVEATSDSFNKGRKFAFVVVSNRQNEVTLEGNNGKTCKTFSHDGIQVQSITRYQH